MSFDIKDLREHPELSEQAIDWFSSKWGIPRKEYEASFKDMYENSGKLPRWFCVIGNNGNIAAGCGLIQNDFVDRTDLYPYMCALFVEPEYRGNAYGARLLARARLEAAKSGYGQLYLCTNHIGYYEKYGWKYLCIGHHPGGDTSRIYTVKTEGILEPMSDFFADRLSVYDEHMISDVEGCRECYPLTAKYLSEVLKGKGCPSLLDLGCGTGLELENIFQAVPNAVVTGIDMSEAMLAKLATRFPDRKLILISGDYTQVNLGNEHFDAAVSFQTLHHLKPREKYALYVKLCNALVKGGTYIECDYMAETEAQEAEFFRESARLRAEQGIKENEIYHYDTPCAVSTQLKLLTEAGFEAAAEARFGNTTLIKAVKK